MAYTQKDPREYCVLTKRFVADDKGNLTGIDTVRVEWENVSGQWKMEEIKGTEQTYPCQLALLALGFLGPQKELAEKFSLKQDARTNIQTPPEVSHPTLHSLTPHRASPRTFQASLPPATADAVNRELPPPPLPSNPAIYRTHISTSPPPLPSLPTALLHASNVEPKLTRYSLVVWGIKDGRSCAAEVDEYLMGDSRLPRQGGIGTRSWVPPHISKVPGQANGNSSDSDSGLEPEVVSKSDVESDGLSAEAEAEAEAVAA